ncbi:MAG: hypothetical protein ABSA75_15725 [Candidatus Bathyarchaeia archaeon]
MTNNYQNEVQTKLTKGLLDMIILQYLDQESMHGYQLITKICKNMVTDSKIRIQAAPLISPRSTLQRENPPLTVC